MNKTGCAHCHTAQGYWEVILNGKTSTAPYKNVTGITCIACHKAGPDGHPIGKELRSGSIQSACTGCHNILVQNDAEDFSHCPQGDMLEGTGGDEFKGYEYSTGAHSEIPRNCVGCHMAPAPGTESALKLGGHTFRVISKGETPRRFNPNGCSDCHDDITFSWVKKKQAETRKLMETLRLLLPQKPKSKHPRSESPRFPKDPSLNSIEAKAAYNYYTILLDGTYGVHNPVYIRQLLESSIDALNTIKKKN